MRQQTVRNIIPTVIGDGASNNGRLTERAYQYISYTGQELLNWEHNFDLHHVDVLLGHENYSWNKKYARVMNTNAAIEGLRALSNFVLNTDTEGYF